MIGMIEALIEAGVPVLVALALREAIAWFRASRKAIENKGKDE